ncbi:MAG: NADP-dependent oxidoreductase [Alphaproteobacteria bacterium]
MTVRKSLEVRLKSRPQGVPTKVNFEMATVDLPAPGSGEVLVRNVWMSVDPYMRSRMIDRESYTPPFQVGQALQGHAIGQVVASNAPELRVGDYVSSMYGWREAYVSKPLGLTRIDPSLAPLQAFLGVLGLTGFTAYVGLLKTAALKSGETVFVSAAAGAVGSIVCQIAKVKGATVIASAGSDDKCRWVREVAKADHVINYKTAGNLTAALRAAAPKGIDVYFENVGGEHLEAALEAMKPFGRVAVCGLISQYNAQAPQPGPSNFFYVVVKRLRVEGFIVSDHLDMLPAFFEDMGAWIHQGRIKWEETIVEGIENAPDAFLGLFRGDNLGKMLVKIGPDAPAKG